MYSRLVSRSVARTSRQMLLGGSSRRVLRVSCAARRAFSSNPAYVQVSSRRTPSFLLASKTSVRCFTTSGSEDAYSRFRSFKSGDQYTKKSLKECVEYTVSVAYSPKERKQQADVLSNDDGGQFADVGSSILSSVTGEDNYIIASTEIGLIVGVLDGVGGWSEQGFDSSAISRELAEKVTKVYMSNPTLAPIDVLNRAFDLVKKEGIVQVGSTTICFGIIDLESKKLTGLNLGDSWFGVFRPVNGKYRCVYQTDEQIYYFNAPYQLSIIPQNFLDEAKRRGSKYLMNVPNDSEKYDFQLQSDDVVIFTTDGLVDNIFPDDIELYLNDQTNIPKRLGSINNEMVLQTKILSLNTNFKSVFSQKYSKETGQPCIGGKPDDITSVMVYVK